VEQHLWDRRVRLAATYFRNDFTNLIQSTLTDPVNFCFQAQNVGKARSEGVELEAGVMPIDGLVLAVAYTYTDTEDRTTGNPLPRVAKNARGDRDLGAAPGPHALRRGPGAVEPVRGPGQPRNPGYTVVNAAAAYRLPIKLGIPVEHHAARPRDEPVQRGLRRGGGLSALGTWVVGGIRATFD
jgi:outer membrane receptor protein involved in Fe transport